MLSFGRRAEQGAKLREWKFEGCPVLILTGQPFCTQEYFYNYKLIIKSRICELKEKTRDLKRKQEI